MALVLGTNSGFVAEAPVADPNEDWGRATVDSFSNATMDTSPASAVKITEIGWWCYNATEEANFEVGLYSDAENGEPETRLFVEDTNAKGTTAGWKRVTVDWEISGSTNYWLAVQCDNVATSTRIDAFWNAKGRARLNAQTSLISDWGTSDYTDPDGMLAIYAVYETAATGTNFQVNVGDSWKEVPGIAVNIGDTWKDVDAIQVNIGDTWKEAFSGGKGPVAP